MFEFCGRKSKQKSSEQNERADDVSTSTPTTETPPKTDISDVVAQQEVKADEKVTIDEVKIGFIDWLDKNLPNTEADHDSPVERGVGEWTEIRLFLSSTFIDTQAERDKIVKVVIPEINRKMAPNFIRIIPVDLRWGVLAEETKSCYAIQKTCLNQIDNCRMNTRQTPWFLGLRTSRYGWVQSEMMPSECFEKPQFYDWIDNLRGTEKTVSITSLEVCHASKTPENLPPYPTVFFYRRQFTEAAKKRLKDDKFRWVFDFEYTDEEVNDPDLKHQYTLVSSAGSYAKDKAELDEYLQNKPHLIFSDYTAHYDGQAYFTNQNDNAKSYGVGYTSMLDEFAHKVEQDLLTAIKMNILVPDATSMDVYLFDTIQHDNAIKLKASTFVGRETMLMEGYEHTQTNDEPHTLILHGEPGCGKSGLLAAVAQKVINNKEEKDFLFVHAVDSCPGSNLLEKFLRRLHVNLRTFRRNRGELNLSPTPPESITDLKQEHHSFIQSTAEAYPDSRFIIIVDAVNQFHASLRAWEMWWLMKTEHSSNVRLIISTLSEENDTFQNAKNSCQNSKTVEVTSMSKEDLVEMVSKTLERYNKKLTNYDDKLCGNQMEMLLSKSTSPLFLIAASEALRKFGIFEKVSEYISSLPSTITELFTFLSDEWSVEYGKMFTEDVCGLIALSKDGLLENQINDILRFKEEQVKGVSGGFLYDSSFSRIYDSVASFLAAGGGGYLRFFHDQLKYTIRDKFLDEEFTRKTQEWMRDFFLSIIEPQLCSDPEGMTPDYYEHVLNQVVHHQLQAAKGTGSLDDLKKTLRNIYFVRERILFGQHNALNNEYLEAIAAAPTQDEANALKLWANFVQLYTPNIKEFPKFAHNMAVNQAPSSVVCRDTLLLPAPPTNEGYPMTWVNIPLANDPMSVKISTKGVDCVASSFDGDVVIVAAGSSAGIYDLTSGEMLHKLAVAAYSVYLAGDEKTLYAGNTEGYVYCYDVDTGTLKSTSVAKTSGCVTWIGASAEGKVVAGSGHSKKSICWDDYTNEDSYMTLEPETLVTIASWSFEAPAYHHTYNHKTRTLFSTHKGYIVGWDGQKTDKLYTGKDGSGCIYCIDSHPTENMVISGNNKLKITEWRILETSLEVVRQVELPCLSGWAFGGVWSVKYSADGTLFYCTEPQSMSIKIYDQGSKKVGELKGHPACVNKISTVPGTTNQVLSCDREDITVIWNLPDDPAHIDACKQDLDEKVKWAGFGSGEKYFVTVTESDVRLWTVEDLSLSQSVQFDGFYRSKGAIHPNGDHLFVTTRMSVLVFDLKLNLLTTCKVLKSSDGSSTDIAVTKDGSKFLVTECRNSNSELSCGFVWDCSDPPNASEKFIKKGYGARMFSCGVSDDGKRGIIGGHSGGVILDLETGDTLLAVDKGCFFSAFLPDSYQFIVADGQSLYRYNSDGTSILTEYSGHKGTINSATFSGNGQYLITGSDDGTVRLFNLETADRLYAFFNHRSQSVSHVVATSSLMGYKYILAPNSNGMLYILKY